MAGYFKKLNGYVYEGSYVAAEALANGEFVELDGSGEVALIDDTKDTNMRVIEKTELWGLDAVVLQVTSVGTEEFYMVENSWDINENEEYDESLYECEAGDYVRMRRPCVGDQLIVSVSAGVYAGLTEGDTVTPNVGGSIA